VRLVNFYATKDYPAPLRRVRYYDVEHDRYLIFLTNAFDLPALTVAALYKSRWQVELFFKWIKQHLRIKAFYGTSRNAVETQVWIAVSVYVLVALLKKRLAVAASLYTVLQVLDVSLFEKTDLTPLLRRADAASALCETANQLSFQDL
jgi:IS4 transposase